MNNLILNNGCLDELNQESIKENNLVTEDVTNNSIDVLNPVDNEETIISDNDVTNESDEDICQNYEKITLMKDGVSLLLDDEYLKQLKSEIENTDLEKDGFYKEFVFSYGNEEYDNDNGYLVVTKVIYFKDINTIMICTVYKTIPRGLVTGTRKLVTTINKGRTNGRYKIYDLNNRKHILIISDISSGNQLRDSFGEICKEHIGMSRLYLPVIIDYFNSNGSDWRLYNQEIQDIQLRERMCLMVH